MNLRKATLLKRNTDDGCEIVEDHVPLGKEYLVDVASIQLIRHVNREFGVDKMRHCIQVFDPVSHRSTGWFILECLEIQED